MLEDGHVLRRQRSQDARHIILPRQACGLAPCRRHRERPHRLDRVEFLGGDDGEEIAVAHHFDHAGHFFHRGRIARGYLGAIARRPHDAGVDHARQPQVLHVSGTAGHLGGNIHAWHRLTHDLVSGWILQPGFRLRLHMQHVASNQIAITEMLTIRCDHSTIVGPEILRRQFEAAGGLGDQ